MSLEEPASEIAANAAAEARGDMAREIGVALRNTIKLGLSLVCTWSVALLVRFQLPRFLGPTDFGALNFADSFAGSFFAIMDLGIDIYIQKEVPTRLKHASDFVGGLFLLRTALTVVLLSVMLGVLGVTHRPPEVRVAAFVFALGYFVASISTTCGALLQASTKVGRLAASNVVAKVAWGAGLLLCIWTKRSMMIFAIPTLASEVLRLVLLLSSARAAVGLELRIDFGALKRAFVASIPYFVSAMVIGISGKVNVSVLEFIATDKREVGWLGAASNLGSLAMIMSPMMTWIFMPMLARARKRSLDEVYTAVRFALEGILVVSIPVSLLIGIGADFWVRLAFGKKYIEAAMSLVAIAPQFVFTYTAMLLSITLVMLDQQWKATRNSVTALVMTPLFIVLIVPISARLGAGGSAAGAALAGVFSEIVISSLCLYYVGRRVIGPRTIAAVTKSVAVAAAVIALDHFMRQDRGVFGMSPAAPLRIAFDMTVYLLGILALGAVRISEAIWVVRTLRHRSL
jgi:O-antigen/teichoic acid export membrane protein